LKKKRKNNNGRGRYRLEVPFLINGHVLSLIQGGKWMMWGRKRAG